MRRRCTAHRLFLIQKKMRLPNTEIFAIPAGFDVEMNDNHAVNIVYAPLTDAIALASFSDIEQLLRFYNDGTAPDNDDLTGLISDMECAETAPAMAAVPDIGKVTRLSLLPNLTCNFACSYCYSAAGRSSAEISWNKVQAVLDYFIDDARIPPQHLSIFISGGGEPLLSWNRVRDAILYARQRAAAKGFTLQISIVTNGSLLTEETARFATDNDCSICVSFEVLPELQNRQRKNFDLVSKNIAMLGRFGVRTLLNSTITPQSAGSMPEMVRTVADNYPFTVQYTVEPVTGVSLFESKEDLRRFYDDFYNGYIAAKQIADARGVNLRFTFDDALRGTAVRHCPGKFCLTPQGDISVCHLASSPKEARYSNCIYGRVEEDGRITIDTERFNELYRINLYSYDRCRDCFAKWSCGGECMTRNDTYPADYMEEVCRFNRRFVKHLLLERIAQSVKEEYGLSLKDYVRQ